MSCSSLFSIFDISHETLSLILIKASTRQGHNSFRVAVASRVNHEVVYFKVRYNSLPLDLHFGHENVKLVCGNFMQDFSLARIQFSPGILPRFCFLPLAVKFYNITQFCRAVKRNTILHNHCSNSEFFLPPEFFKNHNIYSQKIWD